MQNGIDVPVLHRRRPDAVHARGRARGRAPPSASTRARTRTHWDLARSIVPGVPVFSSETYPGWLTHWGETVGAAVARRPAEGGRRSCSAAKKSFNFYVAHGGTNFGFTAGANSGGKGYEPDVTSYDYDAPIDEQGRATPKYHGAARADRRLAARRAGRCRRSRTRFRPSRFPSSPMRRPRVALGPPAGADPSVQPRPFEMYGQNQGLVLYRTKLVGPQERQAGHHRPARLRDGVRGRQARRHARPAARREDDRPAARRQPDAGRSTSSSRAWATSTSRRR